VESGGSKVYYFSSKLKPEGSQVWDYYQKWNQECQKLTIIMKIWMQEISQFAVSFSMESGGPQICDRIEKSKKIFSRASGPEKTYFKNIFDFEIQRHSKCYLNGFWR
jgi:hypothetical protein